MEHKIFPLITLIPWFKTLVVLPPFLRIRVDFHDIFGEPDVNLGRQRKLKMRGSELAEAMAVVVDRMVSAREAQVPSTGP